MHCAILLGTRLMTTCFVVVVCIILFLSTYNQPSKQCRRKSNQSVCRGSLLLVHGCTNIKYNIFKNRVFWSLKMNSTTTALLLLLYLVLSFAGGRQLFIRILAFRKPHVVDYMHVKYPIQSFSTRWSQLSLDSRTTSKTMPSTKQVSFSSLLQVIKEAITIDIIQFDVLSGLAYGLQFFFHYCFFSISSR